MFTEGLDNNALKWVREGSGQQTKEVPISILSERSTIDPIGSMRNGGRGRNAGLPPPSKFRSGHLSGVIPVSRVIPGDLDESASVSDNDMITDSEEEVYGGRYSLDSSPHDDRVPSTTAATQRYYNLPPRRGVAQYASDSMYSDDVSSSMETLGRGRGYIADRLMRGTNRYPIGSSVYTEEESSDSAASSEFSSTQVRTNNRTVPRSTNYASEGYASSIPSKLNTGNKTHKDMTSGNLQKKVASDEDVPSAPPFCNSATEIKEVDERTTASITANVQSVAEDSGLSTTKADSNISSGINHQVKVPNRSDSPVRTTAAAAESGGPSGSYPARLPTFHASALGPWHRVLAYDACVRLCLHAWARGCIEAPMFLESECALLRNSFRLQQVLLQSEEELMANRSSELPKEAAAPKPKQMAGKMKIQVRKVKMGLDPPTGCSFSSLKAPKIKMESVRYHLSNMRSSISSGWRAIRKVHFSPRVPANGSFSRQSLAYMQASTQYIKQVSGLLKIGVTSLRSNPSSYDIVQETYYCFLRLKSSSEEDAIKMQPGSGETHIFFPDSLGDDLIVEVLDSKGQHYGRVLAQVATIAEEPGEKLRWWSVYREPEHELVGKVQLFINYSTTFDDNSHLKAAAKKRSRRHLTETDEYVSGNNEGLLMDAVTVSTAYRKMKSLCMNIRNEIFTDIEIHNQNILPSFIDLPNLSSAIYSVELCCRLRAFLIACPPAGPSPHVTDLVIATADFQRDLACWNIKPIKGGVDAKELFHLYIILWIQDKRLSLLESCKLDKVKWSGVKTQHSTTPFVDEMYERLKETLNDYVIIICRWPEYTFALENAIADIEKAILDALEKQYADVLSPLKENLTPKKFGLKYVQKLAKRSVCPYIVPEDLGILLNSMKRMLDVLRPKIEQQFKSWGSCIPEGGNTAPGERLSEVTVMLRSKFRNYVQAVIEKLAENTKQQNSTKLKKILQDSKENVIESEIRFKMQPLKEQLTSTINHLHTIFEPNVFIASCRGYWDRMGQDVLSFLESRKENRAWYKGSRIAVSILDDTFASQMQQLLGNSLQEKDIEPPRSILEVRSMLCRDASNNKGSTYYY